jgi:hypothetical protein
MSNDILRQEIDGIEYFTVASTGESGMSQRGLSRLCGVRLSTVQNILENLTQKLNYLRRLGLLLLRSYSAIISLVCCGRITLLLLNRIWYTR